MYYEVETVHNIKDKNNSAMQISDKEQWVQWRVNVFSPFMLMTYIKYLIKLNFCTRVLAELLSFVHFLYQN